MCIGVVMLYKWTLETFKKKINYYEFFLPSNRPFNHSEWDKNDEKIPTV